MSDPRHTMSSARCRLLAYDPSSSTAFPHNHSTSSGLCSRDDEDLDATGGARSALSVHMVARRLMPSLSRTHSLAPFVITHSSLITTCSCSINNIPLILFTPHRLTELIMVSSSRLLAGKMSSSTVPTPPSYLSTVPRTRQQMMCFSESSSLPLRIKPT